MRRAAVAVTIAGVIALAGCGAPSVGADTDPAEVPGAEGSTTPEEEAPVDPTDPACLVGDWQIAQDQMQSFYDTLSDGVDGVSVDIEGSTGLSFTATEYRYTPDFTLLLTIEGVGTGEGVTSGSLGGGYTAEDGVVTTALADNDVTVAMTVLGQSIDGTDLLGSFIESDPINQAPFDCSSGAPVLQFETPTGRTPVALTPAS